MANRWGNKGNSERLYFLGLQNHGDCRHEVKRHLLLGIKAMRNLDSLLKSRDKPQGPQNPLENKLEEIWGKKSYDKPRQCIKKQRHHFADKAMIFPVIMYRCESWTIKKAVH